MQLSLSNRIRGILLLLLAVVALRWGYAQSGSQQLRFTPLNIENEGGFSNIGANDILEDRYGYLWLATWTGLARYDGYDISLYRQQLDDTIGLKSNKVHTIYEDSRGNLWVGTRHGGLFKYLRELDQFEQYAADPGNMNSLSNNNVWSIIEDQDGFLWIGTEKGLNRFDPETKQFIHYRHDAHDRRSLSHDFVYDVAQAPDGTIWLGTEEGLNQLVRKGGEEYFVRYELAPDGLSGAEYLAHNFVYEVIPSSYHSNTLWLATSMGVKKVSYGTDEIRQVECRSFMHDDPAGYNLSHPFVADLIEESDSTLWVATYDGLNHLNTRSGKCEAYFAKANTPHRLTSNVLQCLYEDKLGNIWVGLDRGVNKMKSIHSGFVPYFLELTETGIAGASVSAVVPTSKADGVWVGSSDDGLFFVPINAQHSRLGQAKSFRFPNAKMPELCQFVSKLLLDSEGWLWIFTKGAGILRVREETLRQSNGIITEFQQFTQGRHLSDNYVLTGIESIKGYVWIGSWDKGLDVYNLKTGKFLHFPETSDIAVDFQDFPVVHLVETFDNGRSYLWVGTRGAGVYQLEFDEVEERLMLVRHYKSSDTGSYLSNNEINDLFQDSHGRLWVGTDNGLNLFADPSKPEVVSYFEEQGLSSSIIQSILEDNNGDMWISTQYGINRLSLNGDTVVQMKDFHRENGLQDSYFNDDAATVFANQQLIFGGLNGFSLIRPEFIQPDMTQPLIKLSGLRIANETVNIGEKHNGRVLLPQRIDMLDELSLEYNENTVTFSFVGIHLNISGRQQYAYRLVGYDEDWIFTDQKQRLAHYTKLPHGEYTFQVKADNGEGYWSEVRSLRLNIAPPFWLSSWAYLFYLLVLATAIYLGIRYVRLRAEYHHNIKLERLEREKLEEVNRLKLQFFTNISHDLRTPLTLIISPLEQLLREAPSDALRKLYSRMSVNANRLMIMINQLLDIRKNESGLLKLSVSEVDLVKFLLEICDSFNNLATQRDIQLEFHSERDKLMIWADLHQLEKVIFNLLSNAFKFTKDKGKVLVAITEEEDRIQVEISDSGIGIPPEELHRIFDRFYQASSNTEWTRKSGSGIGLSLAKAIVEKHKGAIEVKSTLAEGTSFRILLRKGKEHFSDEELDTLEVSKVPFLAEGGFPAPAESQPDKQASAQASGKEKPSVLVVEDNEDIRAYLRENLSTEYNIIEAENGEIGQEMAITGEPDLIIADIAMPKMDGIEMCQLLKSNLSTSHIPIILLTARTSMVFQLDGIENGADLYLTKPFNMRLLQAHIKNLVEGRKALRKKYAEQLHLSPEAIAIESIDDQLFNRLKEILEANVDQPNFSVDVLASKLSMSRMQLYRKLKAILNQSPVEVIRSYRLQRAAQLLRSGQYNVSEVTYKVGYLDQRSFRKQFKKEFNMSPSAYLNAQKQK